MSLPSTVSTASGGRTSRTTRCASSASARTPGSSRPRRRAAPGDGSPRRAVPHALDRVAWVGRHARVAIAVECWRRQVAACREVVRVGEVGMAVPVVVALSAVIVTVSGDTPRILTVRDALPYGPLDPERDRTLGLGLRRWVREQTGLELDYIEQLYTFGDRGRDSAVAARAPGAGDRLGARPLGRDRRRLRHAAAAARAGRRHLWP